MSRLLTRVRPLSLVALLGLLVISGAQFGAARAAAPVTVTMWTASWDSTVGATGIAAGYKAVLAAFERSHPDITIDWKLYTPQQDPSTYQTLLTAIAGGSAPDIAEIDRFLVAEFAEKGAIEPIGPYLPKDAASITVAHRVPGAWEELHGYDGQLYGITAYYGAVGFWSLYYNKALFKAAGIANPPRTWAELNQDAKLLTKMAGPRIVQLGYEPYPDQAGEFYNYVYEGLHHLVSPDGKTAMLNTPALVAALQENVAVVDAEGGWDKVSRLMPISGKTPPSQDPRYNGSAAMTDGGDWYLQTIASFNPKMSIGVVPLPTQSGRHHGAWAGGWSLQLVKGAAHPKEAAVWLDYMATRAAASTWVAAYTAYNAAHHIPNVMIGGVDFAYPDLVTKYSQGLKAQYPDLYNAVLAFVNAPTSGQYDQTFARDRNAVPGELWRAATNAAQAALSHKMTPQQALTQQNGILQTAINNFYKK